MLIKREKSKYQKISSGHNFENYETELVALQSLDMVLYVIKIAYQLVYGCENC